MKKDKFAVIKLGGKQYLVGEGDTIEVNKLNEEPGKSFSIEEVILCSDNGKVEVGNPTVKAKVEAKVVEHMRGEKVVKKTYKHKSRYRKTVGHRQELSKVEILKIS